MSQPRMRKAPVRAAYSGPRPRVAVSKASGDTGPCAPVHNQQHQKRSRNKIPKSIRYDLENALVNLCDVWFEEIKPHLVRNNIKLHVHGSPGPAGGDHRRLPPGAPGCSHLDPGAASDQCPPPAASCADCCSTPPTVLKAPSLKLPMLRAQSRSRLLLPSLPFPLSPPLINQNLTTKGSPKRRHRLRKNKRSSKFSSAQDTWRVPRICRTYSALPPLATPQAILRRIHTAKQSRQRRTSFMIEMKNKSTQTDFLSSHMRCSIQPISQNPFDRCNATTSFFPSKHRNIAKALLSSPKNCDPQHSISKEPQSLKEFINIVEEKHDKRLRLLYKSPIREECSSILNLVQSTKDSTIEACNRKKKPWR